MRTNLPKKHCRVSALPSDGNGHPDCHLEPISRMNQQHYWLLHVMEGEGTTCAAVMLAHQSAPLCHSLQQTHTWHLSITFAGFTAHSKLPKEDKGLLLPIDFLNDGHARDPVPVLPKAGPQLLQEAPVDVVDDLHVAWQQALHQADWPLL